MYAIKFRLNIVNKTNCKLFGTNYVPVMKSLRCVLPMRISSVITTF